MNGHKQIGSAVWLLALFAAFTPDGWTGDAPTLVAGGNIISDSELTDRLQITRGTLASWRRRLRRARLLDWLVRPGIGRAYIIGAAIQTLPRQPAALQRVAEAKSVQALRSTLGETNAGSARRPASRLDSATGAGDNSLFCRIF